MHDLAPSLPVSQKLLRSLMHYPILSILPTPFLPMLITNSIFVAQALVHDDPQLSTVKYQCQLSVILDLVPTPL